MTAALAASRRKRLLGLTSALRSCSISQTGFLMRFSSESTPQQAATYLRYVAAREPHVLQFFARSMAQSGGPVDDMDASFASINILWDWVVDHVNAGCPG